MVKYNHRHTTTNDLPSLKSQKEAAKFCKRVLTDSLFETFHDFLSESASRIVSLFHKTKQ